MKEKQECGDGQMESHGVRVECQEVFLHTERWRVREEVASLCKHQFDGYQERLQRVDGAVMRIRWMMAMDQTGTGTSWTD